MSTKDNSLEASFQQLLDEHEAQTNKFADKINWLWTGLFGLFLGIDIYYFYAIANNTINICAVIFYIAMFVSAHFIVKRIGYGHKWAKVVFIVPIIISCCMLRVLSTYNPTTLFAVLILVSGLYLDKKYVIRMASASIVLLVISGIAYILIDFDHMASGSSITVKDQLVWHTLPNFIVLIIITVYSIFVAENIKKNLHNLLTASTENATLHNELSIARDIQEGQLDPPYSDGIDYKVNASMVSAKEVGGDFYFYSRYDERYFVYGIADVSGKGVPSSLMAVRARTIIGSFINLGFGGATSIDRLNAALCTNNPHKLFMTAFIATLDIKTGTVGFTNAGHNPPLIKHADGSVEIMKVKPNFVLGRKKAFHFESEEITLKPGESMFLYTDGITEAMNPHGEQFGLERLTNALTECVEISHIQRKIKEFTGGAEQSDDITMLLLEYLSNGESYRQCSRTFEIKPDNHTDVINFVTALPIESGCSEKFKNDLSICADEIFANLDMYAFKEGDSKKEVTITTTIWDDKFKASFADNGVAFNPLEVDNSNATDAVKRHKKGGLGIYMIKKLTDSFYYQYNNRQNIITIEKTLDGKWR